MMRVEARLCIVCRCGDMEENESKAVHCLQVWRHGRRWKQRGALSAGVASRKMMEAKRCNVCRSCVMEEDGSKAVHCLQVWQNGGGWKQGDALYAGVASGKRMEARRCIVCGCDIVVFMRESQA